MNAGPATGTCRSCFRPVTWAVTDKGKRIPLDVSTADGRFYVYRDALGAWHASTTKPEDGRTWYRADAHFSSCPNANAHRSKR